MNRTSLLDRIHAAMLESARPWTASELARAFLKLTGDGPAPEALIRSLLAPDTRFAEEARGRWTARKHAAPPLARDRYLLSWVETGNSSAVDGWRLHLRPHHAEGGARPVSLGAAGGPEAFDEIRRRWEDLRLATFQPGALGRFLQWTERRWGIPEWDPPALDLLAWTRTALLREGLAAAETQKAARLSELSVRWGFAPIREDPAGAPLPAMAALLDHLLESFGTWTEDALAEAWNDGFASRPVPWERFAFSQADVDAIPDASGIYRFFDEGDGLLYVGKAVRLARRVGSYFRPLPPEAGKREELLGTIRRFEIEPLPSELEALVREGEAIRCEHPPWNVQVEVHPDDRVPPGWWWPLVFVAPGADPLRVSVFLVPAPERALLFHLPREGRADDLLDLAAWLDRVLEPAGSPSRPEEAAGPELPEPSEPPAAAGVRVLQPPEARLVLRYFLRERDRLHRVDSVHFTNGYGLTEALLELAREAAAGPIDRRPGRRE